VVDRRLRVTAPPRVLGPLLHHDLQVAYTNDLGGPWPFGKRAKGLAQQPFLFAVRDVVGAADTEERFAIRMMIRCDGEIARPHDPVDAERIDDAAQLCEQIAIGKRLA